MTLDNKTIKKIKTKLIKEQKRLETELKKLREYHDYGQSDDANAQEIEEFEGSLALSKNLQKVLADIKGALSRIEDGSYGRCQVGGEEIPTARLVAYPATTTCATH